MIRQTPKSRGFKSLQTKPEVVNIQDLVKNFQKDAQITPEKMREKGLIRKTTSRIKILGQGKIDKSLTVIADAFSKTAKDAITKAGGKTQIRV